MKRLQIAFKTNLEIEGISKKAFADRAKIDPAELSRFLKKGTLSNRIRNKLLTEWVSDLTKLSMFTAYTLDLLEETHLSRTIKLSNNLK